MTVLIVGGGRVGLRTARILAVEGHDVVVVENDEEKCDRIEEEGFPVVHGDGANADVLEHAGIADARGVAGLTGDLNTNFAACMLGVEHGCRTVLRIDRDYRKAIYEKYADQVDEVIYPEQLGATAAKTALLGGNFNAIADLTEELRLITVKIPEESPVIGERVHAIEEVLDLTDARIYAHGRRDESMTIPLPGTEVEVGDRVAVIAERDAVERVRAALLGTGESAAT